MEKINFYKEKYDLFNTFIQQSLNVEGLPFIVTKNSKEALGEQAVAMLMLDLKRAEERAEMEEYKDGFKKDDTMNVMSVTKSVTSLLIGIAIDQGLINNVEGVMHFFESTYRLINKYNQKNKVAKTYGTEDLLYSAEVHMIEIIGDYETITTTKLAKTLGITKGAVSQITHKLLKKSLIDKIPSVEKNNEVLISLTDRGRIVYSHHQNMHKKMMERIDAIICNLSEEGKAALVQIVQVIDESLDDL